MPPTPLRILTACGSTASPTKRHGNVWNCEYQFYIDPEYVWSNSYTPFAIVEGVLRLRAELAGPLGFRPSELQNDSLTGAPYDWVSGVLTSQHRFAQQGGYFKIDACMPKGAGTWRVFWLLPTEQPVQ